MTEALSLDPVACSIAALVLAIVLTGNYFYAVQRLDIRAGGRYRRVASWRRIAACAGAAVVPAVTAWLVLVMSTRGWSSGGSFVLACVLLGWLSQQLMDAILRPKRRT